MTSLYNRISLLRLNVNDTTMDASQRIRVMRRLLWRGTYYLRFLR